MNRDHEAASERFAQRALFITLIGGTIIAVEAALVPRIGMLPVLLTAFFAMPAVLIYLRIRWSETIATRRPSTDEKHWQRGIFYVNPDDKAVFVPKRSGLGYTLNFAHAKAWIILGLTLLFPIALALIANSRH